MPWVFGGLNMPSTPEAVTSVRAVGLQPPMDSDEESDDEQGGARIFVPPRKRRRQLK